MSRIFKNVRPTKMWIDGMCFDIKKFQTEPETLCQPEVKYEISTNSEGKLFTAFRLPSIYYAKLLRFPNFDLKSLEDDTKTNISMPRDSTQNLVISGELEEHIKSARTVIHSIVGEIRIQQKPEQFVSIPTTSEEIVANFNKFKEEILNGDKINGMEESIFISPNKLHLTVAVFAFLDNNEIQEATKVLQTCKHLILDSLLEKYGPLKIEVDGIDCMNNNYKKVDVLYAKARIINETEDLTLQKIVNDISDQFYNQGFIAKQYEGDVKLHMTLINTKYRKTSNSPKTKRWTKRVSFDARSIMEKYKDLHFGTCPLKSIHLSLMSSVGDDGFYKPLIVVNVE